MTFVWPRDANPYLPPEERKRATAPVRREADRAWRQWLAEHPAPAPTDWSDYPAWMARYQEWLANWPRPRAAGP